MLGIMILEVLESLVCVFSAVCVREIVVSVSTMKLSAAFWKDFAQIRDTIMFPPINFSDKLKIPPINFSDIS